MQSRLYVADIVEPRAFSGYTGVHFGMMCRGNWTYLSIVRRHASLVSFFEAGMVNNFRVCRNRWKAVPLSSLPTLITYGNGIWEVKLKEMSSTMSRSTASSLCLSCSRTYLDLLQWSVLLILCKRTAGSMSISPTIDLDFAACSGKRTV